MLGGAAWSRDAALVLADCLGDQRPAAQRRVWRSAGTPAAYDVAAAGRELRTAGRFVGALIAGEVDAKMHLKLQFATR